MEKTEQLNDNDWMGLSGGLLGGSFYGTSIDTIIISGSYKGGEYNGLLWNVKKILLLFLIIYFL